MILHSEGCQLVYRPDQDVPVLFRPAAQLPATAAADHLFDLMADLKSRIGTNWRDDWIMPLWASISLLPVAEMAAASDPELSDILRQTEEYLAERKQSDPVEMQDWENHALHAIHHRLDALITKYFFELDKTSGWSKGRSFIETHPVLLSDDADRMLVRWIAESRAQGNQKQVERLEQFLEIVRRSRVVGIRTAFAEKQAQTLQLLFQNSSLEDLQAALAQEFPADRVVAIQNLLKAIDPEREAEQWIFLQVELGNAYTRDAETSAFPSSGRNDRFDRFTNALAAYQRALSRIDPASSPDQWANVQRNIAQCEITLGDYDSAEKRLLDALSMDGSATGDNSKVALDIALLNARFFDAIQPPIALEQLDGVIELGESTLALIQPSDYPFEYPRLLAQLALCYATRQSGGRQQNMQRCRDLTMEAFRYVSEDMPVFTRWMIGRLKGNYCYHEEHDLDCAYEGYVVGTQAIENMYELAGSQELDLMVRLATLVYDSLIWVCTEKSKTEPACSRDAMIFIEGNKARMYRDQLGDGEIPHPPDLAPIQLQQEHDLLQQLRETDIALFQPAPATSPEADLVKRRRGIKARLRQLWSEVGATPEAEEYVALRLSKAPDWEDLRTLAGQLGRDTAIVEFYTREENTLALVLRAGDAAPRLHILPLPINNIIMPYADSYREEALQRVLLPMSPTHDWLELGRELLEPLEPALAGTKLVYFIPHGILHVFPLHALTVGDAPFIVRRAVAYAPSAAILGRLLRKERNFAGCAPMLSMGYTLNEKEKEIFLGEARDIASLFGVRAFVDDEATSSRLRSLAPGASRIHLSCHGSVDLDAPMESGVQLADGMYSALDWMQAPLVADLVTISACEMGFPDVAYGDEVTGLTRAMFYAGASTTLSPLWSVSARSARAWFQEFYSELTASPAATKVEAFRNATLAIRHRWPDPWHWAPYVLSGDWR